jgi:hypothetical protein
MWGVGRQSHPHVVSMAIGTRVNASPATIYARKSRFLSSPGISFFWTITVRRIRLSKLLRRAGGSEMRQNVRVLKAVQYLDQINTDFHKQLIELEKLREAILLAEAGRPSHQSEKLRRPRIDPKVIEPLAGSQLRA